MHIIQNKRNVSNQSNLHYFENCNKKHNFQYEYIFLRIYYSDIAKKFTKNTN